MKTKNSIALVLLAISVVSLRAMEERGTKRKIGEVEQWEHCHDDNLSENDLYEDIGCLWNYLPFEMQCAIFSHSTISGDIMRALKTGNRAEAGILLRQFEDPRSVDKKFRFYFTNELKKVFPLLIKDTFLIKKIFLKAAKAGNVATLRLLCENGFAGAENLEELLISAIGCGKIDFSQELIKQHFFDNVENPELIHAIILQNAVRVESLLADGKGQGMLFDKFSERLVAALVGNSDIFNLFPRCTETIKFESSLPSTLSCSVRNGHLRLMCSLLHDKESLYSIDEADLYQEFDWDVVTEELLVIAACFGHGEMVNYLVSQSKIDAPWTNMNSCFVPQAALAVSCAGANGHEEIFRFLLNRLDDTDLEGIMPPNYNGDQASLFECLCGFGHIKIIKMLIERTVFNVNGENRWEKAWSPFLEAVYSGCLEMVMLLIDNGADVNWANDEGRTPLMEAAANGHLEIMELLVAKGAMVDAVDRAGLTAADRANKENKSEAHAFLLKITGMRNN